MSLSKSDSDAANLYIRKCCKELHSMVNQIESEFTKGGPNTNNKIYYVPSYKENEEPHGWIQPQYGCIGCKKHYFVECEGYRGELEFCSFNCFKKFEGDDTQGVLLCDGEEFNNARKSVQDFINFWCYSFALKKYMAKNDTTEESSSSSTTTTTTTTTSTSSGTAASVPTTDEAVVAIHPSRTSEGCPIIMDITKDNVHNYLYHHQVRGPAKVGKAPTVKKMKHLRDGKEVLGPQAREIPGEGQNNSTIYRFAGVEFPKNQRMFPYQRPHKE